MSRTNDEDSFFAQERDRLVSEISSVGPITNVFFVTSANSLLPLGKNQGFEELLSLTNVLNRQVEEVFSMSTEYETVANLWNSFHQIVQDQDETTSTGQPGETEDGGTTPHPAGLPGTGTHILTDQLKENT